jgi:hypothetical protein
VKECGALTKQQAGCHNSHLPFSRYCWRHQDISSWVLGTIIGIVAGALINLAGVLYQDRTPELQINFSSVENGDPCILTSTITNSGRAEARDVFVSFNNMLPLDTKVLASPELGITILESENPPDPMMHPQEAKLQKAFAIRIPRIAAKDTIRFQVITSNVDNQRAGKQILRIREAIKDVLQDFGGRLSKTSPEDAKKWNFDAVLSARTKDENLFTPAQISYEKGRATISSFTEEERLANAINQDLYAKYKKDFIDIYQGRPEFKAPVIRIKTTLGESTYAVFPPYVKSYVEMSVPIDEVKKAGGTLNVTVPVPKSY